jgi:hypothetical protein
LRRARRSAAPANRLSSTTLTTLFFENGSTRLTGT